MLSFDAQYKTVIVTLLNYLLSGVGLKDYWSRLGLGLEDHWSWPWKC